MKIAACVHLPKKIVGPRAEVCEENHVCNYGQRVCLTCGYVGCCDSCEQHMRIHAKKTGHQVMASYPANKDSFIWCYIDDDYLQPDEKYNLQSITVERKV